MTNSLASERVAIVEAIDPDSTSAGTASSGWVDASQFHRFMAIIQTGDMGSPGTVDAKIEEATDSSGTGAQDISGKSVTQLDGNSDSQAIINLQQEDLDLDDNYTHFRLTITVGDDATDVSGLVLGVDPRHGPANDFDVSSVVEIV